MTERMRISCTRCQKALEYVETKGMCSCRTAYYCSRVCKRLDRKRHAPFCSDTEAQGLLVKTYFGAGSLFRVCCGIFYDPCEAYAYALSIRLGLPKNVLRLISCSDKGDKPLFRLLRESNFDALVFVSTIYTHFHMVVSADDVVGMLERACLPPPEIYVSIARFELLILSQTVESDDNAVALYLMVNAQDPLLHQTQAFLQMKSRLMELYNSRARDPLRGVVDRLLSGRAWVDDVD